MTTRHMTIKLGSVKVCCNHAFDSLSLLTQAFEEFFMQSMQEETFFKQCWQASFDNLKGSWGSEYFQF